ncbi:MAG: cysteine desulfurase [Pseudomonadota bacterium]|nr:cysteine desulfurase [Pseudomonadota bacterium]
MNPKQNFDVSHIRKDFPILSQKIHGHSLAFLDNAASSQQPIKVTQAVKDYHEQDHANVHRGVHHLSHKATDAYEAARDKIAKFINTSSSKEIVFTSGTTEAINLLAATMESKIVAGDEILITHMEHHSNIVPWYRLCEKTKASLIVAPINQKGELILEEMIDLISNKTRLVACSHVSNALGTINPVEEIINAAHKRGVPVLIDGAQAIPHQSIDVNELDCDFYVFSGHKMCAPTGTGVFYAKEHILKEMPPWQGGGEMILSVSFDEIIYNDLPYRFEAGTPNISGVVGLGAAVDYLEDIGMDKIASYEKNLLNYLTESLGKAPGIRLIGTAENRAGVQSFTMEGAHPHDLGTVLDHQGVAIRTGHHCAMPVMEFFNVPGTARASLSFYNVESEIDQLIEGLSVARDMFL